MTDNDIKEFSRKVDSLIFGADGIPDMYRRLHVLQTHGTGGWLLLRNPTWVGDKLVVVVVRPSRDGI